jgi:hypothetical protein
MFLEIDDWGLELNLTENEEVISSKLLLKVRHREEYIMRNSCHRQCPDLQNMLLRYTTLSYFKPQIE